MLHRYVTTMLHKYVIFWVKWYIVGSTRQITLARNITEYFLAETNSCFFKNNNPTKIYIFPKLWADAEFLKNVKKNCFCFFKVKLFLLSIQNYFNVSKPRLSWFVISRILLYVHEIGNWKLFVKNRIFSQIIVFSCKFLPLFPFIFILIPLDPFKWVQERSEKQQINWVWPDYF